MPTSLTVESTWALRALRLICQASPVANSTYRTGLSIVASPFWTVEPSRAGIRKNSFSALISCRAHVA